MIAAFAALFLLPMVASAATWTPPADVVTTEPCDNYTWGCNSPDVATAPDGTTTAVWLSASASPGQVRVATRAAGAAAFGTPIDVGDPATLSATPDNGSYVSIAISGDGTTFLAWRDGWDIQIATRAPGADAFTIQTISSSPESWPTIAAGANGLATVVWTCFGNRTCASTRAVGASTFSDSEYIQLTNVSIQGRPWRPLVGVAPDGTTVAGWFDGPGDTLRLRSRPGDSTTWSAAVQTITSVGYTTYSLAVGGDGTMGLAWQSTADPYPVLAAVRPAGGATTFGSELTVNATGTVPDAAFDANGNLHVVWFDSDTYKANALPAGTGSFGSAVTLSTQASGAGMPGRPQIAASADGSVTAAYTVMPSSDRVVEARTLPAGAASYDPAVILSSASTLTGFMDFPMLAGGPGNLMTAVWPSGGRTAVSTAWTLPNQHALTVTKAGAGTGTVTSAPAGIDCGATCTANFDDGSTVTLTATPASGSKFGGWSGAGCSGTSTCAVTMSAAQSVTATFDAAPASTPAASSGSGSSSGSKPKADAAMAVRVPGSRASDGLAVLPDRTLALPLECPPGIPGGCGANGVLSMNLPKPRSGGVRVRRTVVLGRFSGVQIATGKRRLHTLRLARAAYAALQRAGIRRVPATLRIVTRRADGSSIVTSERVWLRIVPRGPVPAVTG